MNRYTVCIVIEQTVEAEDADQALDIAANMYENYSSMAIIDRKENN